MSEAKPYNLANPPHLIANEVLRSVDNEGIHTAIERLIRQYQDELGKLEVDALRWQNHMKSERGEA